MITEIVNCRVCDSSKLAVVLELGSQSLSGVFPIVGEPDPIEGPLTLVICQNCTLVQLKHSFPSSLMYGDNYGYRSGLNGSMVNHLSKKANSLLKRYSPERGGVILDVGSNDGTLLNSLSNRGLKLFGMDPTSAKFREYYNEDVSVLTEFFSAEHFLAKSDPANIIFSIAMFYDLDRPVDFAKQIELSLSQEGIWHFEQSYILSMIDTTSYDTICHEHVEYYSFSSIEQILKRAGLKVIDIELNDINGGSIAITAAKENSKHTESRMVSWIKAYESNKFEDPLESLENFRKNVISHRENLSSLINLLSADGKRIWGLGASTKGNVLLQYCGINGDLIEKIVDVNPYKHGRWTPTTHIPIVSEENFNAGNADYALVLPWHFKSTLVPRSQQFLADGGKLIFPLPDITFV
jgi:hypothetical protein